MRGRGAPPLPPISSPHFLDGQTDGTGSPGSRGACVRFLSQPLLHDTMAVAGADFPPRIQEGAPAAGLGP